ncbi:PilW family protein [Ferrimonas pelagia]|uniref:PilW family protein n=1 Tax=Ferrimonas pelagia TaxID=1177826 RepID=A0ABP9EBU4_9GAMM
MKLQSGLTLPELMVALLVGLFVVAASLTVFTMSSTSVLSTSQYNQLQESGRLALRLIHDDLAQAGFFADLTGLDLIENINLQLPEKTEGTDCVGAGLNNATFPNGLGHFRTIWAYTKGSGAKLSCENGALSGSDVLQVKRLVGPEVSVASDERYYFHVNVSQGAFFHHQSPVPSIGNGRIFEYQHKAYYVRNSPEGIPTLYRHALSSKDFLLGSEPLVEGVEAMQLEFGIDFDNNGTTDSYVATSEVDDAIWDQRQSARVLAVRVHLLLRSLEPDNSYQDGGERVFDMPGGALTKGGDGYRRKRLTTTVMIRNAQLISRRNG